MRYTKEKHLELAEQHLISAKSFLDDPAPVNEPDKCFDQQVELCKYHIEIAKLLKSSWE